MTVFQDSSLGLPQGKTAPTPHAVRTEFLLFLAAFVTYAWFHQGGGWNQNSRFAQVRAIVEGGTFAIDEYLVYRERDPDGGSRRLDRLPLRNGELLLHGLRLRLCWADSEWKLTPVNGSAGSPSRLVPLEEVAASGDVSFKDGHFYPNKPPGAVFAAVPAYALILGVEHVLGFDPDDWWVLNVNLWLTNVLSNGLLAALGVLVFHRTARILSGDDAGAAFAATLLFAFGTMYLPFATVLFDHDFTAVSLLLSFYLILESQGRPAFWASFLSGLAAGFAAITNYLAAVAVVLLGLYLVAKRYRFSRADFRRDLSWLAFGGGVSVMLAAICIYNWRCFGAFTAISNTYQSPSFEAGSSRFLGMFGLPNPGIAVLLLVSPFRGIFYTSPVLLPGVWGWFEMRRRGYRDEVLLCVAMAVFFLLMNVAFNGWHGGFTTVPRYLVPAVPFLALPLVFAFRRFRVATLVLGGISVGMQFLVTAVDVQAPPGVGSLAMIEGRPQWLHDPVTGYVLPLFAVGKASPLLSALSNQHLEKENARLAAAGMENEEREEKLAELRRALQQNMDRGDPSPFLLAGVRGPVSANVVGPWEGEFFNRFNAGSEPARWASFNAGEFVFPGSRWSLVPLLLIVPPLLVGAAWRGGGGRQAEPSQPVLTRSSADSCASTRVRKIFSSMPVSFA